MTEQPSASDFIQASRVLKVMSPLGKDQLLPERVTVEEGVNQLFSIELMVRAKRDVKPDELIGRLIDVSIEVEQGEDGGESVRRPFNGLVTELREGPPVTRGLRAYTLVLRPQLWLLSQRSDCRIWMDKTSLEVLEALLSEHGLPAADSAGVISPPPAQHYSVQWNETDLDYLTRRLEEDGIWHWFSHEEGQHKVHVADHASGWLEPSEAARGEARVRIAQGSSDRNHINDWGRTYSYVPGARAGADFNFETPRAIPSAVTPSLVSLPDNAKRELFEYPARAMTIEAAERQKKLRMQAREADHDRVFGRSNIRILESGRRFTPYEEAHPDHTYEEHVIIKALHRVVDRSYESNSTEPEYQNTFEAVPARVSMTPHRATPRPRIDGTHIGVVAGPAGEEIHVDKYGRVKLWYPWDRRAKKDGSDTKWVEVVQSWGGGTWGTRINPRIGMQAIVSHENGDPDRPYVIGLVANADNMVPYDLPANKTKSTFRTNTHKGKGFNELSFEDEKDREEVYLHAQKDLTTKVENHATERVDANKIVSVGGMSLTEVELSSTENVAQNLTINVGTGALGNLISGEARRDRFGLRPAGYFLSSSLNQGLGRGNLSIDAANSIRMNTATAFTVEVSGVHVTTVGAGYTANVGGAMFVSSGLDYREVVAKKKMIDAHGEIHFRCGKSEILMQPDGTIKMKGVKLIVEEEEHIDMKAGRIDLNS